MSYFVRHRLGMCVMDRTTGSIEVAYSDEDVHATINEFKNGRGEFFSQETLNGPAILVRFVHIGHHVEFVRLRTVVFR